MTNEPHGARKRFGELLQARGWVRVDAAAWEQAVTANKKPRAVTAERARVLIDAWDEHGEELLFVENADGTTVHVVACNGPGPKAFGLSADEILDLAMGAVYTVCGLRVRCNRGGLEEGGRLTDRFAD